MKFKIKKDDFEKALVISQSYIEKRDISQITSHILLEANEDKITIRATDYEIGIEIKIEAEVETSGKTTANGKKLLTIIRSLKNDKIEIESIEGKQIKIEQGLSKYKIPSLNPEEFPKFPEIKEENEIKIDKIEFIKSLKKITPDIDNNNPKIELNGALFDNNENKLNLVATDTKRLGIAQIESKNKEEFKIIVPKKAVSEIQKITFDDTKIYFDQNYLILKSNNLKFFTKLINGNYPDYKKVIPNIKEYEIKLNRSELISEIKKINILSENIKLTFKKDGILIEALSEEAIEAKSFIEKEIDIDSEFYFGANSRFILDFLNNATSEEITLIFNDKDLPFMLEEKNFKTIIMPLTI